MTEATASRAPDPEPGSAAPDVEDVDDEPEYSDPHEPGPALPPPTAVESLVNALLEAGPDVAEHVVRAAQELLLAAQTVVDAAQRAVEEQQALRPPAAGSADAESATASPSPPSDPPSDPPTPGSRSEAHGAGSGDEAETRATVHHLDVAE
jgi:hypothetical protein